jgi:hypothetical protein
MINNDLSQQLRCETQVGGRQGSLDESDRVFSPMKSSPVDDRRRLRR